MMGRWNENENAMELHLRGYEREHEHDQSSTRCQTGHCWEILIWIWTWVLEWISLCASGLRSMQWRCAGMLPLALYS